jgi:SsrA-binding protein
MKTLALNRRASHDYDFLERFEAGIVLSGQETKSAKTNNLRLKGAFVTFSENQPYLTNAFIAPYPNAGPLKDYHPDAPRKLLLKKSEIRTLLGKKQSQGLTIVPIRAFVNRRGLIKIEIALARGKKQFDKRASIAKRETNRSIARTFRERNR